MAVLSRISYSFVILYILASSPFHFSKFFLDLILCLPPWTRPSREWTLIQAVRMRVVRLILFYWSLSKLGNRLSLRDGAEGNRFEVMPPRYTKAYQGPLVQDPVIEPRPLGATWTPARPPPEELSRAGMVVALHFHGGAYVIGDGRDSDTGYLAKTFLRHTGCTHVCTPQYRLSSGDRGYFPAPLQDAVTAYLHLTRTQRIPASQIILSGDSAGANLALALLRYIQEHGAELDMALPAAVGLWSPWVDVSGALRQDMSKSPNYGTDYLNKGFGRWGATTVSNFGRVDVGGPYLSPLHHPFALDPSIPVFVNAGQREVLCDDIRAFCDRYREEAGWSIHLEESRGCPHDIILLGSRAGFAKEAEAAARAAGSFYAQRTALPLRCRQAV